MRSLLYYVFAMIILSFILRYIILPIDANIMEEKELPYRNFCAEEGMGFQFVQYGGYVECYNITSREIIKFSAKDLVLKK